MASCATGQQIGAFDASVHSLALTGLDSDEMGQHLLAVGLENGSIRVLSLQMEKATGSLLSQQCVWTSPPHLSHAAAVRRLCWQGSRDPGLRECTKQKEHLIASAGDDHAVHVYRIEV